MSGLMLSRRTKLGAAGAFSPDQIAGLQLWLKADSLALADGDPVGTWADSSVNARNATQSTAAKKPVYKTNIINGKPVVRFDGVDDFLLNALDLDGAKTTFLVIKLLTVPSGSFTLLRSKRSTTSKMSEIVVSGNASYGPLSLRDDMGDDSLTGAKTTAGVTLDLNAHVYATTYDAVSSTAVSSYKVYSDGTAATLAASGGYGAVADHKGAIAARVDSLDSPTLPSHADFAEILVYNSVLSTADRQAVENSLKTKYGTP